MITVARLKEVLEYRAADGVFLWKKSLNPRGKTGSIAGCIARGRQERVVIGIDGTTYLAHRLVWMWHNGEIPKQQIDHIDGNSLNNRISNLRLANNAQNHQNLRRARKDNASSGLLGVSKNFAGKWRARITVNGKEISLGTFDTKEAAYAAYIGAKRALHSHGTL